MNTYFVGREKKKIRRAIVDYCYYYYYCLLLTSRDETRERSQLRERASDSVHTVLALAREREREREEGSEGGTMGGRGHQPQTKPVIKNGTETKNGTVHQLP
jgi:hypothetical protein